MTPLRFILAGLVCALLTPLSALERIAVAPEGTHFVEKASGKRFVPWGFNYDHDADGRLLEDYWDSEWATVEEDFREMKALGANVVRIHLQVGRFLEAPDKPRPAALERLRQLIDLAESTGLYLDLTGLGCYHRQDTPAWYDTLDERARWDAQATFWRAIATIARGRGTVFCYDLMNEPLAPGGNKKVADWVSGELGGKYFVQSITRDPAGRTSHEVARQWVAHLAKVIREVDAETLLTVGVIPWALTFPKAKPLFHDPEVGKPLDFVSVHFYPESGKIDQALEALRVYELGKPLLVEEIFPLKCRVEELEDFMKRASSWVDGWIGFYWGRRPEEYPAGDLSGAFVRSWLNFFQTRRDAFLPPAAPKPAERPAGEE